MRGQDKNDSAYKGSTQTDHTGEKGGSAAGTGMTEEFP